ncbi:MAG: ribonuclease R [Pseudomonadota bacterium]
MPKRRNKQSGGVSADTSGRRASGKKHSNKATQARNRYTAEEILQFFSKRAQPISWAEMVELAGADNPRSITQLRQMLRGMQRNGQLQRDQHGHYHVAGAVGPGSAPNPDQHPGQPRQARVQRIGKQLAVEDCVIEDAYRLHLREDDLIEYNRQGDDIRVLNVVEHSQVPLIGVLNWQGKYATVDALGTYRGRVTLVEQPTSGSHGDSVSVRIVDRDRRGLVGVILEQLQPLNVLDQAIATAIASGDIPFEWPDEVEQAVARLPKRVYANRYPKRRNLTKMALVTIDGETARDFDDAVFAEKLPRSGRRQQQWRLVVAIADVAHYVKTGSALDKEALQRGTSVYFPERVIAMLPEAISNELCSLKPNTPRLSLVCDMVIDQRGVVRSHEFYEAVIHSRARLTYNQVQAHLDGELPAADLPVAKGFVDAVERSLQALQQVYERLRKRREQRGALDFATREGSVVLKDGAVTEIVEVGRQTSHQLIEEAMVAANVCAAEFLEAHDRPGLYRVHESPDVDKLEELRQALAIAGVRLPAGPLDPIALQQAMLTLPDSHNKWLYAQLALRSLKQAIYTPNNQGHFGLALQRYMHFTSPIRRYPDLLVHRAIKAVLAEQQGSGKQHRPPSLDQLQQLGVTCSNHERRAESAGWLVDGWLKCDFLQREVGNTLPGIVAGVTDFGLFVEIDNYFIQGLLHISSLGSDYFHFQARSLSLVGERSGRRFSLGDPLQVVITDIEPAQGRINLELAGSGPSGGRSSSGRGKRDSDKKRKGRKRRG